MRRQDGLLTKLLKSLPAIWRGLPPFEKSAGAPVGAVDGPAGVVAESQAAQVLGGGGANSVGRGHLDDGGEDPSGTATGSIVGEV